MMEQQTPMNCLTKYLEIKMKKTISSLMVPMNIVSLLLLFVSSFTFGQFTIPEKPNFQTSVYDFAKVLSDSEAKELEGKLIRYSDSTSTQIVFISIEDLNGEDIGILTPKWAHQWGIGQEKEDNGILIFTFQKRQKNMDSSRLWCRRKTYCRNQW